MWWHTAISDANTEKKASVWLSQLPQGTSVSTELCTHPLQELNDGFLVLFCSAIQVLQPQLQLFPRVFEHTCVPKNLLAAEPCKCQNRSCLLCSCKIHTKVPDLRDCMHHSQVYCTSSSPRMDPHC